MRFFCNFTSISLTLLCASCLFLTSCSQTGDNRSVTSGNTEVYVKADASLKPTLLELAQNYLSVTSVKINFRFSPTFKLLDGAAADSVDVYIFSNNHFIDLAEASNLIDTTKQVTLAYAVPSLIVSSMNPILVSNLSDLKEGQLRIGIADPESDLLGLFSLEIFKENNLYDQIGHRLVMVGPTAVDLTDRVSKCELDVAICWTMASNWRPESFDVVLLMPNEIPRVAVISAARSATPVDSANTARFMTYLKSDRCQSVFRKWGYLTSQSDIDVYAPAATIGGEPIL